MPSSPGSILDLRRGEGALAAMMFAYSVALLVTLYLLKPARDSLFLTALGPERLPFVFLAVAVAVMPVVLLYGRLGRRLQIYRLVLGTTLVLLASLVTLRLAIALEVPWVYFALYVWVSIYSVLATSQFWLLAGAVFDAAQAKRLFALLSLGAILGAVIGGELTAWLVENLALPTVDLLWVAMGVLGATLALVTAIQVRAGRTTDALRREEAPEADESAPTLLGRSRHLQLITAVIAVAVLTTALVDFQFKTAATRAFPLEGDLTTFMGKFYGRVSLIALALQLFLAPRLIRMRGVGGALLLLPLGLAVGAVAMLAAPGLLAATLLRGTDQSLKHSIDRTGRELLFLPVPLATKKRVKVFIDVFVDQGMQGLGGLLLLGALALGLDLQALSLVVLALLLLWIGLAVAARRSYVQAFREALPRRTGSAPDTPTRREPPDDLAQLLRALSSSRTSEVLRALDRLEAADVAVPPEQAKGLLRRGTAEVRRRVLALLAKQRERGLTDLVAGFLRDRDAAVRLEAARYLYRAEEGNHLPLIQQGLTHPDVRVRAATVGVVAESGGERERALLTDDVLRSLLRYEGEGATDARVEAAKALGALHRLAYSRTLYDLLDDPEPEVVAAAIRAAGHTGNRRYVSKLLDLLGTAEFEEAAREALLSYGERIFGTLYDCLTDDTVEEPVRRNIPRMLAHAPSQAAADLLLLSLERLRAPLLYDVAKALNKLRQQAPSLRFSHVPIDAAVHAEIRALATVQTILYHHTRSPDEHAQHPEAHRVQEALRKERKQNLERVFRLLGLRYPSADMHSAYLGLTEDADLRAPAAEFLDSVLDWEYKRHLVPLLDEAPDEGDVQVAEAMAGKPLRTWQEALEDLLLKRHPRPLACALAAASEALPDRLATLALAACTPDPSDDPPEMREEPPPFRPSGNGTAETARRR